jgi:hypothetical protein
MDIKSKPITQLEEEAEVDMELRIDRTEEDSANTPKIFNKYHKEYRLVKTELMTNQLALKRLWIKKWYYYSGKAHPKVYEENPLDHKIMKSDVKMHIEADDDILKITYTIEILEIKKKFIEEKLREINNRSYHIGNIIKSIYFKHGIN